MRLCSRAELATRGFAISLITSASVALADCFLILFLPTVPTMSRVRTDYRSIWIKRPLLAWYSSHGVVITFSSFRSSDLSQSI